MLGHHVFLSADLAMTFPRQSGTPARERYRAFAREYIPKVMIENINRQLRRMHAEQGVMAFEIITLLEKLRDDVRAADAAHAAVNAGAGNLAADIAAAQANRDSAELDLSAAHIAYIEARNGGGTDAELEAAREALALARAHAREMLRVFSELVALEERVNSAQARLAAARQRLAAHEDLSDSVDGWWFYDFVIRAYETYGDGGGILGESHEMRIAVNCRRGTAFCGIIDYTSALRPRPPFIQGQGRTNIAPHRFIGRVQHRVQPRPLFTGTATQFAQMNMSVLATENSLIIFTGRLEGNISDTISFCRCVDTLALKNASTAARGERFAWLTNGWLDSHATIARGDRTAQVRRHTGARFAEITVFYEVLLFDSRTRMTRAYLMDIFETRLFRTLHGSGVSFDHIHLGTLNRQMDDVFLFAPLSIPGVRNHVFAIYPKQEDEENDGDAAQNLS